MNSPMKQLLESWKLYAEKLSVKEKEKSRKKKLFGVSPEDDADQPPAMRALANGIITDQNANHDQLGLFDDEEGKGSYSLDGKQTERSGKGLGRSQARCGRLKRQDGHKYKCKDGTLREDEIDGNNDIDAAYIKATVERAVKKAVGEALKSVSKQTGCSVQYCLNLVNAVNRSEDGKLYDKAKAK